ncbi:MAG TPA: DUF2628 domain-containing protein [Pseudolabrys sp.]|jgi:hypothetical protein|nr:DUF2628 domain-containing protein [Pseudolabrys sp.]
MPTFTVHEPPPRKGDTATDPQRIVFVRDGFYVWAFLLGPLWMLVHRLWLVLVLYIALNIGLDVGFHLLGASPAIHYAVTALLALLIGFEAATLWRWTLTRRRWKTLGFVVAEDMELAERRFFAAWTARASAAAPAVTPEPSFSAPVRRGAPTASDVIGLFPEPGEPR